MAAPDQADPVAWQEERAAEQGVWRQNYSSVADWSAECVKIMNDQAERGQVLRMRGSAEIPRVDGGITWSDQEGEARWRSDCEDSV